jgi:deoxyribodipyrimidine photo-lyase
MIDLFIFFRDYRIKDNLGLIQTMNSQKQVVPIFVFVDEQINPHKNQYFSHNSVQFLCESLQSLNQQFNDYNGELYIFKGPTLYHVLNEIHNNVNINSISYNKDYTAYALERSEKIQKWCVTHKVEYNAYEDYLLAPIGTFNRLPNVPYSVYGAFKTNVYKHINAIPRSKNIRVKNIVKMNLLKKIKYYYTNLDDLYIYNNKHIVIGGRDNGIKRMKNIQQNQYDEKHNELAYSTTLLSAYIKYGCLSIREVFWYFKDKSLIGLCDQLVWREFYYYIAYYFPRILKYGESFRQRFDNIKWKKYKPYYLKWANGKTGYPIVDACMMELNTTGYMHNRGRLIVSNFLNRILGMDWRMGEKYFATKLIDYDPCVNNGNWQWVASSGVDTKPYVQRIFNPWLQSSKYDKDCKYIKKWLPQLSHISNKEIHNWEKYYSKYDLEELGYMKPMIAYSEGRRNSIEQYEKI